MIRWLTGPASRAAPQLGQVRASTALLMAIVLLRPRRDSARYHARHPPRATVRGGPRTIDRGDPDRRRSGPRRGAAEEKPAALLAARRDRRGARGLRGLSRVPGDAPVRVERHGGGADDLD